MESNFLSEQLCVASEHLRSGEVVAFPTETFFGLAADPCSEQAMDALLELKSRSLQSGVPLIVNDASVVERWIGGESEEARQSRLSLQDTFWPGPLTLVVASNDLARRSLHPGVFGPHRSLAFRLSSSKTARSLAAAVGGLITATSANPKGKAPPQTSEEVRSYFPKLFVLDRELCEEESLAQDCRFTSPSTLLNLSTSPFSIIREGALSKEDLKEWL